MSREIPAPFCESLRVKFPLATQLPDLSYNRTCSKYASEQYEFPYTIRIADQNGKYYITEIDTESQFFYYNSKARRGPARYMAA